MSGVPAIVLRHLTKEYRRDQIHVPVLSDLSLAVEGRLLLAVGVV